MRGGVHGPAGGLAFGGRRGGYGRGVRGHDRAGGFSAHIRAGLNGPGRAGWEGEVDGEGGEGGQGGGR
ncbi:hypothetical protein GCM10020001_084020 [Nonomuraea salmonea]